MGRDRRPPQKKDPLHEVKLGEVPRIPLDDQAKLDAVPLAIAALVADYPQVTIRSLRQLEVVFNEGDVTLRLHRRGEGSIALVITRERIGAQRAVEEAKAKGLLAELDRHVEVVRRVWDMGEAPPADVLRSVVTAAGRALGKAVEDVEPAEAPAAPVKA